MRPRLHFAWLSRTERITVIAALTVALALAYAGVDRLVYAKAAHRRAQLQVDATQAWHDLFVAQNQAARAAQAKTAADEDAIALTTDPVLTAHTQLTEFARTAHVHIVSVTPGPSARVGETLRTPLTVAVQGRYADIVRFLAHAENSALLTQVNGVSITTPTNGGARLEAQVALLVITVPPGAPPS